MHPSELPPQPEVFSMAELEAFAKRNSYELPQVVVESMNTGDFSRVNLQCIDGRRGGQSESPESETFTIEVPGGALGVFQTVLAALPVESFEHNARSCV